MNCLNHYNKYSVEVIQAYHSHDTRQALHPHIESSKKKIFSNSFIHKAPELWSKVPAVIKDCPSISSFSKRIKNTFIHLINYLITKSSRTYV